MSLKSLFLSVQGTQQIQKQKVGMKLLIKGRVGDSLTVYININYLRSSSRQAGTNSKGSQVKEVLINICYKVTYCDSQFVFFITDGLKDTER